mgnify:CR=1 FL=1
MKHVKSLNKPMNSNLGEKTGWTVSVRHLASQHVRHPVQ